MPNITTNHVITYTNRIEAMYRKPCVNVKIERGSTFTLARESGNPPSVILKIYVVEIFVNEKLLTCKV